MKDPRTIYNTPRAEIARILEAAEARKTKAWKQPRKCEAKECKNIFTPSRHWQIYCSDVCKTAVRYQREQSAKGREMYQMAQLVAENERLEKENEELVKEVKLLRSLRGN